MGPIARRSAVVAVISLVLAACSGGHPNTQPHVVQRSTATSVSAAAACSMPTSLGSGVSIPPARLGAIDFLSPETGLALSAKAIPCEVPLGVGKGQNILQQAQPVLLAMTTDGGTDWVTEGAPISPSTTTATTAIEQVVAGSATMVWALDNEGTLLVTANSGTTWTAQSLPSPVLQIVKNGTWLWTLSCPSPSAPGTCSPVVERAPLTGGAWERLAAIPQVESGFLSSLNVVSSEVAVLVFSPHGDTAGTLVITTDEGESWDVQATPRGPGNLCTSYPDLASANPSDWWLLCVGGAAAGSSTKALMQTLDGGQTWRTVASVPSLVTPNPPGSLTLGEPAALAAGSSSDLWLAGFNSLTESSDGGVTWTRVPGVNGQGSSTGAFDVWSPRTAWMLAPGTGLWGTTDGSTWHALGAVTTY